MSGATLLLPNVNSIPNTKCVTMSSTRSDGRPFFEDFGHQNGLFYKTSICYETIFILPPEQERLGTLIQYGCSGMLHMTCGNFTMINSTNKRQTLKMQIRRIEYIDMFCYFTVDNSIVYHYIETNTFTTTSNLQLRILT